MTPGVRHILILLVPLGVWWTLSAAGWSREQAFALAILAWTALSWALEALPLFATAFISIAAQMFVLSNPAGWSWLGFEQDGGPEPRAFLAAATDPVLVLFFAGLVLSRAISKTGVDQSVAARVLRPMADTPQRLLLGVIVTTAGFSLLMSNTATTALMLALIAPILRQLPAGDPFRKALIIAVPLSANVAGMSTPIASPPNAIAVSYLARAGVGIGFNSWMMLAVPLVAVLLVLTWRWLLRLYPPSTIGYGLVFNETRLTPAAHFHAAMMGSWLVLLLAQTWLMATGRRAFHQKLGMLSVALVPAMILAGFFLVVATHAQLAEALAAAPAGDASFGRLASADNAANILLAQARIGILFAFCVGWALLVRRRDAGLHKRLMILGTVVLLPPAFARMSFLPSTMPDSYLAQDIYTLLWISPMFLWDLHRLRAIHPAYLIWLAAFVPLSAVVHYFWGTEMWLATARALMT